MLKKLFIFSASILFAQSKTCSIHLPGMLQTEAKTVEFTIVNDSSIKQKTNNLDGSVLIHHYPVEKSEHKISKDLLLKKEDDGSLNLGERFILHSYIVTRDPLALSVSDLTFDLHSVDSVTVYDFDPLERDWLFRLGLVVAYDLNKKELGTFWAGFLPLLCH